jgi:hypothetical protein
MTRFPTFLFASALAALTATTALAQTASAPAAKPVSRPMTCPIGGGQFTFVTVGSIASWGERPDGKPFGSFPLDIPECPDNGLVLYKDYEPVEVAKLEPLVASEAYQAMRKEDVPFYRAYWLMTQMGVQSEARLIALQRATWAAEGKPELRARYLAEFAAETAKQPRKPDALNWIGMEGRAINALRELGRFDEAAARLAKVPLSSLAVAEPKPDDRGEAAGQARSRRAWQTYFQALKAVNARGDASMEPFDMLPRREWIGRCLDGKGLSDSQQAHCTAQADAVEAERAARAKQEAELKLLQEKRDKSGR